MLHWLLPRHDDTAGNGVGPRDHTPSLQEPVKRRAPLARALAEFIESVQVYDRQLKTFRDIQAKDCAFSYRHSIFKDDPNRYVITHVTFKLFKKEDLKISYGDLKQAVGDELTAFNLQQQVIQIRQSKLPDPKEFPNVGSFFKNPIISQQAYDLLAQQFEKLPHYPQPNGDVKIAAGWLIDQSGWKGKQLGVVGMFAKQALVLVNYACRLERSTEHIPCSTAGCV